MDTPTIWADFNAELVPGRVSLKPRGSQRDLARICPRPGDMLRLEDGDMSVLARYERDADGEWARVDWSTLEYADETGR